MDFLDDIRRESAALLAATQAGPLDAPVPSCPGWSVGRLAGHVAQVQHHYGGHLRKATLDPPQGKPVRAPQAMPELGEYLAEGTAMLLEVLAETPRDTPAWNFSPASDDKTATFWHRRMAHEALIHRWDAQQARGQADPIDTRLALDGIAEFLSVFLPRFRTDDDPHGTVRLVADEGREYHSRWGESQATAALTGPAADLLLVVWGRAPLDTVEVEGDEGLAASIINR